MRITLTKEGSPMIKLAALLLLFALMPTAYLFLANPFNWFVPRSKDYSEEIFEMITPGEKLDAVKQRLGEPTATFLDPDLGECPGCSIVYFMGPAPNWLPTYQEAIVFVDSSGTILSSRTHEEP
jgi:hypothetical protein